jgi:TRAP-type C4-dicarboxylate transport system substrate-binding protein
MKRNRFFSMAFALTATLTVITLTSGMAGAAGNQLRVVGSWSSLTAFTNFEKPFWTEIVPKEMGMEVSMTSLSQVNLKGPAVMRQMKMGVFDVVHTVADYVVEDSPALAGLDLPALAPDIASARKVVDSYRPIMEKYLSRDFDVKLLSITPYPAQVLFLRDRISSLADLKGKKIRASGWTTSEFVTALGATGVTMNFSEVPQSLQRGVVDGAITGSLSGYSAGWGDVAKYVYPLPMGGWDYIIGTISMKTWEGLSKEQQTTLQTLIHEKLELPAWEVTERETIEGIQCLTGGECPHGAPAKLGLIPVTAEAQEASYDLLRNNVLPAWSSKVKPEVIQEWNSTIGKQVGLIAK